MSDPSIIDGVDRRALENVTDFVGAALDLCGVDGVPQLVFELAFRLALRDQL